MTTDEMKWLLKNKIVTDFRGYPIGRVKKLWIDSSDGPMVIVERDKRPNASSSWEAIPLRAIDRIRSEIRLKPPAFAE
ncbi:hypothetical protein EU537_02930 [Candidatus Thorarchaeota archaeon]|nr:MAG: hypothetical protein EU537_02930 [Candidatus Thorarchaeota archaeon]